MSSPSSDINLCAEGDLFTVVVDEMIFPGGVSAFDDDHFWTCISSDTIGLCIDPRKHCGSIVLIDGKILTILFDSMKRVSD